MYPGIAIDAQGQAEACPCRSGGVFRGSGVDTDAAQHTLLRFSNALDFAFAYRGFVEREIFRVQNG